METTNPRLPSDRSVIQENLFSLYLRLNGYFVTGFIVHASRGNRTEMDALAVRFPYHREPQREVGPSPALGTSDCLLDFLVCEVKGGTGTINFNPAFREEPEAIAGVLNRFGTFSQEEIANMIPRIQSLLRPDYIQRLRCYPTLEIPSINAQLRFVLVAADQEGKEPKAAPFGDYCFVGPEGTRRAEAPGPRSSEARVGAPSLDEARLATRPARGGSLATHVEPSIFFCRT